MPDSNPQKTQAAIYLKGYLERILSASTKKKVKVGSQVFLYADVKVATWAVFKLMLSLRSPVDANGQTADYVETRRRHLGVTLELLLFTA